MSKSFELKFHPLALDEYQRSVRWYEEARTGLGKQFVDEVERMLDLIEAKPFIFPVKRVIFREAVVKTFPYVIIYKINLRQRLIVVLSVFHTGQHPSRKTKGRGT